MNKLNHKEYLILSRITKLKGYSDENFWSIGVSKDIKDTFISNVKATVSYGAKINILYEGSAKEIPVDLQEKLLCVSDSSENPSRPFRWYKGGGCGYTDDPTNIEKTRTESLNFVLEKIDNPEKVFIYELEIL